MKKSVSALLSVGLLFAALAPKASAESAINNQQSNYAPQIQTLDSPFSESNNNFMNFTIPSFTIAATSSSWSATLSKDQTANSKTFNLSSKSTVTISIDQGPSSGSSNVKFSYTLSTVSGNVVNPPYPVIVNVGDKYGAPAQYSWTNVLPGSYVVIIKNTGDVKGYSDGDVYTTNSN